MKVFLFYLFWCFKFYIILLLSFYSFIFLSYLICLIFVFSSLFSPIVLVQLLLNFRYYLVDLIHFNHVFTLTLIILFIYLSFYLFYLNSLNSYFLLRALVSKCVSFNLFFFKIPFLYVVTCSVLLSACQSTNRQEALFFRMTTITEKSTVYYIPCNCSELQQSVKVYIEHRMSRTVVLKG